MQYVHVYIQPVCRSSNEGESSSSVKPQHMCEGYGSHFVCVCVRVCIYVSVTVLVATYLVYMAKVRWHTISYRLLKICIVGTLLKTFPSGDMALFAHHDDPGYSALS